jgi:crotonobetainyl-CoA:carnitine CoA-transferase CaiB-like acyl-CoA transferase
VVRTTEGGDLPVSPATPLAGLRVLDLSRILAGPYCAQMLADHGAHVVKVEAPAGDDTRRWGPPFLPGDSSSYFHGVNRSKQNICLDLSVVSGREVLRDLISTADVVVENFKFGTMQRWGLDYASHLAVRHPGLVYCRISGFGDDGPLGGMAGYDAALQSYGGLMSVNGEADGEPLRVGVPIVDIVAANLAFSGILLALLERGASQRGQCVEITLLDAVISILHPHSASWIETGSVPARTGGAHPAVAPYQVFRTPAGALFIGAANDRQFAALVDVLCRPDLATDSRFGTNRDRVANLVLLQDKLTELIGQFDVDELAEQLIARGVPASPLHDVAQALQSAQVAHRNLIVGAGAYRGIGVPIKLSRSRASPARPPAHKGQDTVEVLAGLGYTEATIAELRAQGTFGDVLR